MGAGFIEGGGQQDRMGDEEREGGRGQREAIEGRDEGHGGKEMKEVMRCGDGGAMRQEGGESKEKNRSFKRQLVGCLFERDDGNEC